MNKITIKQVAMIIDSKTLSIDLFINNVYKITSDSSKKLNYIFKILTYQIIPERGEVFINDINLNDISSHVYRNKMISIFSKKNTFFEEMKVKKFLNFIFDNYHINNDVESIDYRKALKELCSSIHSDKMNFNDKIKNLSLEEKLSLKIIEILLKGGGFLIINEVFDDLEDDNYLLYFNYLREITEKYRLGIIVLTTKNTKVNYVKQINL